MSAQPNLQTVATPQYTECVSAEDTGRPRGVQSRQMAKRLNDLIEQIQTQPNTAARALLQDCVQSLLAFYGEGLLRIRDSLQNADEEGREVFKALLRDEIVSSLLLIHGLHPESLEERLLGALEQVRPYMQSHGGNIELLNLENDVARIRLDGTCKSCPSSSVTLELAVRKAVEEACPDLLGFEVVGTAAPETVASK